MGNLLTVQEAADRLRVTKATVYQWIEERPPRIPFIRLGQRAVRFDADDLDAWVEAQRVQASP